MYIEGKPRLIAILFVGGTTLLFGGAAVAASLSPSGARMLHMTAAHRAQTSTPAALSSPAATSPPTATSTNVTPKPTPKTVKSKPSTIASHASSKTTRTSAVKAPITYTVRPGDTLSGIAAWFKLHGYGNLYAANAKTIGANPNLIHPGERITIGTHVMKLQGPA